MSPGRKRSGRFRRAPLALWSAELCAGAPWPMSAPCGPWWGGGSVFGAGGGRGGPGRRGMTRCEVDVGKLKGPEAHCGHLVCGRRSPDRQHRGGASGTWTRNELRLTQLSVCSPLVGRGLGGRGIGYRARHRLHHGTRSPGSANVWTPMWGASLKKPSQPSPCPPPPSYLAPWLRPPSCPSRHRPSQMPPSTSTPFSAPASLPVARSLFLPAAYHAAAAKSPPRGLRFGIWPRHVRLGRCIKRWLGRGRERHATVGRPQASGLRLRVSADARGDGAGCVALAPRRRALRPRAIGGRGASAGGGLRCVAGRSGRRAAPCRWLHGVPGRLGARRPVPSAER